MISFYFFCVQINFSELIIFMKTELWQLGPNWGKYKHAIMKKSINLILNRLEIRANLGLLMITNFPMILLSIQ